MITLPELPYDYSSLEPFIDTETMHIHHDKHHAGYVDNLNKLVTGEEKLEGLLGSDNPKIRNNAGGHINHTFFWGIMCANSNFQLPISNGKLLKNVENTFGSFEAFQEKFAEVAMGRFGSGWVWLIKNNGKLEIMDTANQDSPISISNLITPILCLDVWEHAYYLKYKNMRADYIKAWWNVVNWSEVERLYDVE